MLTHLGFDKSLHALNPSLTSDRQRIFWIHLDCPFDGQLSSGGSIGCPSVHQPRVNRFAFATDGTFDVQPTDQAITSNNGSRCIGDTGIKIFWGHL